MALTEREPLSRPRVAAAALALIDERGLEQLSMRKLGAELGVEAMSLYNHVANKDDLLGAVADLLYEQILTEYGVPSGNWQAQARVMAASYVSVAIAHPHAFPLLLNRPPVGEGGLRFMDRIVTIFDDVTDDLHIAALAFSVVANWVVGTLVQREDPNAELEPPSEAGFERVAAFRAELVNGMTDEERFSEGLETVLAGVEARYFST
ncbi:MAG: TetR/AcrR family transcriptional regulator [Acidimicrobiales bacterium]|jgi:AcrR family transcriptional regulator